MMSSAFRLFVLSFSAILFTISTVHAEDQTANAQARAGELKVWREQCSEPDPDMRLAYIEAAIASGDVSIQRICIRQALESDNADVRNLALRAALSATNQITFTTTMPPKLASAYKYAGDDEEKLKEVHDEVTDQYYQQIKNGLTIVIDKASIENGESIWLPLCYNTKPWDKFSIGKAVITGSTINWTGDIYYSNDSWRKCTIKVSSQNGGRLTGVLDCSGAEPFSITADLL